MFTGFFVVVLALLGSEFGRIVEATDSATCANLKQSALTVVRKPTPYTSACKCGVAISKIEVLNVTTGVNETRETCTGCRTAHVPVRDSPYCTTASTSSSCICKNVCSGLNVYTCSCVAIPVAPPTTAASPAEPAVDFLNY